MASRVSRDTSEEVGEITDPQILGEAFVKEYYFILQNNPEVLHKFYKEESVLVRPGPDGKMESVTTKQCIKNMIVPSDYKGCSVKITSIDIQASDAGGILVAVTGDLIGKDSLRKTFWQTFFIAKRERRLYFVLNDILRFMEAHESLSHSSTNGTDAYASNVPLNCAQETPVHHEPVQSSMRTEVMQNEKESTVEDTLTEASNPPVAPSKNEEWFIIDSSSLILSDSNTEQDTQKTPNTAVDYFLRKLATAMKLSAH